MGNERSRLVYTTDDGRICPECGKPAAGCVCRRGRRAAPAPGERTSERDTGGSHRPPCRQGGTAGAGAAGTARVRRETKGRGGKTVTTVSDLALDEARLAALAAALKKRCGCGGSVKDGIIVIQGDHADVIVQELQKQGFPAKRAGG
ncbi:MAG: stress response translation initiation inhibitor YciH [Candidatus Riflebacteria bacterium]|nr:stress response translation initiation inhibitor YciH [Candidatus Riflebacteria bacterium]